MSDNVLQPVETRGWRMGFANLFRKENGEWWRTRTWLWQAILWTAIINGVLAGMLWATPDAGEGATEAEQQAAVEDFRAEMQDGNVALMVFSMIGGMAAGIGVIIMAQEEIIDERQNGTLAWVLSKPASRAAFFFAKFAANAIAILAVMVALQGALAYLQLSLWGAPPPIGPFIGALALIGLDLIFYLTLTLMLGVVTKSRGATIGIPMAVLFTFQLLPEPLRGLFSLMPWGLVFTDQANNMPLSVVLASGEPLPTIMPIVATLIWCLVFVVVGLWRFEQEEF